jgi:site-specific DNA-methyltransferase (adenine-specific)
MTSETQARMIRGDSRVWLPQMTKSSVHAIITDPPYQSLDKHRAIGTTTRLKRAWFPTMPNEDIAETLRAGYDLLVPDAHCYLFCDDTTRRELTALCEAIGFRYWKSLIWDKRMIGMGYHYRSQHEYILFFEKGKRKLNNLGVPDVLPFYPVRKSSKFPDPYPTQKPEELLSVLIQQSTSPGEIILDPWAGSGSLLGAARDAGRHAIGFDVQEEALATWAAREALPVRQAPPLSELLRIGKSLPLLDALDGDAE